MMATQGGSGRVRPLLVVAVLLVAVTATVLVLAERGWPPFGDAASLTPTPSRSQAPSRSVSASGTGTAAPVQTQPGPTQPGPTQPGPRATVTVAAVGDMSCDPSDAEYNGGAGTATRCRQKAVSDLVVARRPALLLALGDLQYRTGSAADYRAAYTPSYGRLRAITRPAVGNHEYLTAGATGYWDYFGDLAGPRGKGWYSFTAGTWHIVVLNSNCSEVSCAATSEQLRWLRADLAAHPVRCTLAMWHHPRWSSGSEHGDDPEMAPFVEAAYAAGVDVILSGHDHNYERFAPLNPAGRLDRARGVRSFVVGTGGRNLRGVGRKPTTEAVSASSFGALFLTLRPGSYAWSFVPAAGGTFTDAGSASCH